ncbi:DNA-directed RNA polymerase I subunit 2 [Lathyrus oleraceus]|nr:DNA-directed RNA polymerase I subunit 2-like [Pisum sativum]
MLKFKRCNLRGASPRKLVSLKEEASEMGGYFIVNGLERYIRPIIMPKRNYPMSTVRSSFSEKREGYADKAVVIRCVRADQTSLTVKLYYLRNGSARLGFWIQGREYMLPVGIFLKALIDTTDREIYVNLTSCYNEKYEKEKEKYAITDMRKLANRMQFGIPEESSLGDGLGEGYGMLGQAGSGKLRVSAGQSKLAAKVAKKFKEKDYGSSGATSGLTSSLAFTPVNGIELTNPQAHAHQLGNGTQSTYFSETGTI